MQVNDLPKDYEIQLTGEKKVKKIALYPTISRIERVQMPVSTEKYPIEEKS